MTNDLRQRVAEAIGIEMDRMKTFASTSMCECLADAAIAAMPGWRPIKTAPKDGSPILSWDSREDWPCVIQWHAYRGADGGYWRYSEDLLDEDGLETNPSFWMPLPLPPHPEGE